MLFVIVFLSLISCAQQQQKKERLTIQDIEIFENTEAWDLAKAINRNNIHEIENAMRKNPSVVNFQEPAFGTTCLMRAISTEKYQSAKTLLANGANPNIIAKTGSTALFRAIAYSWYDTKANDNPKFVKLLLDYKADPNMAYYPPPPPMEGVTYSPEYGTSPLIFSISRGFEKVKLLVNAGADINYKTKSGTTAAYAALLMQDVDAAYFLIVQHKAKVTEPVYGYMLTDTIDYSKKFYPVDELLDWFFELDSPQYNKKKAIIAEFARQGVNYEDRKGNISKLTLRRIKKMHPDDWQEFIKKY